MRRPHRPACYRPGGAGTIQKIVDEFVASERVSWGLV